MQVHYLKINLQPDLFPVFLFFKMKKIDLKGILSFLIITFTLTYLLEFAIISQGISPIVKGFGQYVVALAMWIPGIAALFTVKFITKEPLKILNIKFGKVKPYIISALVIPFCFLLIYGITWISGCGKPDWYLNHFLDAFSSSNITVPELPHPSIIWSGMFFTTMIFAPILNGIFGFGEELGWRGFLLTKLMPLGKWKAYTILGIVWGLWHMPLIVSGFVYPGYPLLGVIMFSVLLFCFGIYMNELFLKHQSSILAGWIHGVFNSQRLGMWALLFPETNALFGGYGGVIGIIIWTVLGLVIVKINSSTKLSQH